MLGKVASILGLSTSSDTVVESKQSSKRKAVYQMAGWDLGRFLL